MVQQECVCEVKVDLKLSLALFGIVMTTSESPDCNFLNGANAKLLEGIPREALRTAALDCWKRWTAAGVDVT